MSGDLPEVGSVWISRDRRDDGKRVTVEAVDVAFAYITTGARRSRVRLPLSRLYRPAPSPVSAPAPGTEGEETT